MQAWKRSHSPLAMFYYYARPDMYGSLDGLISLLGLIRNSEDLRLSLPGDHDNRTAALFTYNSTFPENGSWPNWTTFFIENLTINVSDLIEL